MAVHAFEILRSFCKGHNKTEALTTPHRLRDEGQPPKTSSITMRQQFQRYTLQHSSNSVPRTASSTQKGLLAQASQPRCFATFALRNGRDPLSWTNQKHLDNEYGGDFYLIVGSQDGIVHLDDRFPPVDRSYDALAYRRHDLPEHDIPQRFVPARLAAHSILDNGQFTTARLSLSCAEGSLGWITRPRIPERPSLHLCLDWIDECSKWHEDCPAIEARAAPTRLIKVGQPNQDHLRLVELPHCGGAGGGRSSFSKAKYVTLSHCWGGTTLGLTTRSNYLDRLEGFSFENPPQTYKDAVKITRELGFEYLWIDSLCIIQDRDGDWETERARMEHIYENSAVTIAGTNSSSPTAGILHPRPPTLFASCEMGSTTSGFHIVMSLYDFEKSDPYAPPFEETTLGQRAWVFQERLLLPRVIYFHQTQMAFGCQTNELFEHLYFPVFPHHGCEPGFSKHEFGRKRLMTESPHDIWARIVRFYSGMDLTFASDRLPALSELARRFQANYLDDIDGYLAGLWRSNFLNGLSWELAAKEPEVVVQDTPQREHADTYRGPSWSWVAADAPVHSFYSKCLVSPGEICYNMEILEATTTSSSVDTYGGLSSGFLRAKTRVRNVLCHTTEDRFGLQCSSAPDDSYFRVWLRLDDGDTVVEGRVIVFLLLWLRTENSFVALFVDPVPETPDTFRRSGIAHWVCSAERCNDPVTDWNLAEERVVTVI